MLQVFEMTVWCFVNVLHTECPQKRVTLRDKFFIFSFIQNCILDIKSYFNNK